jgi:hypothetical protein
MITIVIKRKFNEDIVASLKITDRITIVAGDSSTGKTHICSMLEKRDDSAFVVDVKDSKSRNVELNYCATLENFEQLMYDENKDNSVIVIDEYVASRLNKIENMKSRGYMDKCCKYFVIFQRDCVIKYHIGVNSVYKVIYEDKQYKFEKLLRFNDDYKLGNITKCNTMIVEDSASGYQVLNKYFDIDNKMRVIKGNGNGDIHKDLQKFSQSNVICGLDYDKGSWALYNIHKLIGKETLDRRKLYFINMESFEEILCNSDLILDKCPDMRDYVEHIENHMDCTFRHRGEYFMFLLKKWFVTKAGYALYGKNKVHCFVNECKECTATNCKFRDDSQDKVSLIFANKYKIFYELYCYLIEN